jgi:hypothetical protein
MTQEGAAKLAERIELYWTKRGRRIHVWIEDSGLQCSSAMPIWVVRSNVATVCR